MGLSHLTALLVLSLLLWGIFAYNALVRSKNRAEGAWSQIDVQLKRRHDLIPNLVRVVERYLEHERDTLTAVTRARREAMEAAGHIIGQARAEDVLSKSLKSLFAVIERYPDLKANSSIRDLIEQLITAENRISFARQYYNDSVLILNNRVETYPQHFIAALCGFSGKEFFELAKTEERSPAPVKMPARGRPTS